MNIRKFWRLSCLTVASLFWASCSSDSNPQFPIAQAANPDSSADATESSSSDAALTESSSSLPTEEATSSSDEGTSSSLDAAMSSSNVESSSSVGATSVSSSSEAVKYVLARDPSVTCSKSVNFIQDCPKASPSYSCVDLQTFLKKDTTISEKILTSWEEKLESCGVVQENAPVYGVVYPVCPYRTVNYLKCSDGKNYDLFKEENGVAYTTESEYYETHSSATESSSSVVASSSSVPEDLVKNCPKSEFVVFADILAEVRSKLYERLVKNIEENTALSDSVKSYLETLLDRDNKTLKGNFSPYFPGSDQNVESTSLKWDSEEWFNGYIAKTESCADGTPVTTKRYQQKYAAIYDECLDIISKKINDIIENESKAAE